MEQKIVYVTKEQITCMGEDGDHPKVYYTLKKGEAVYAWDDGVCSTVQTTALVGIALESSDVKSEKLVECVLKV